MRKSRSAATSSVDWNRFSKIVQKEMQDWKVPGCAVGILRDDETIFAEGFGIRGLKKRAPVTPRTLFAIASCSKAFTSVAVAIAVDEGKIEWDTPVRHFLPDFKLHDSFASERITPRDLLIHCSGLPRHDDVWWRSEASREELVHRVRYLEPNKDFRTVYQYQNLMYVVAGYLVGKVYGTSWESFVQERLLDPLEMSATNFAILDSLKADDYAFPHFLRKGKTKSLDFCTMLHAVGPAGNMNSNVEDMLKWVRFHLNKGKHDGARLVCEDQILKTHSPQFVCEPSGFDAMPYLTYAMGWHTTQYGQRRLLYHGGNVGGFSCNTSFMPDNDIGIVVLTNVSTSPLSRVISYSAYDMLLELKPRPWGKMLREQVDKEKEVGRKKERERKKSRKANTQPSHPLEAYAGDFSNPGYGLFSVRLQEGKLLTTFNTKTLPLEHYHFDVFERLDALYGARIFVTFHTNKQGEIESLSVPFEPEVKDIVFARITQGK